MARSASTAPASTRKPLRIALQGGGALGAYSAGVLDMLLASPRIELTHFSGTSAGAINAVVCASALATGNRDSAREALESFWQSVASSHMSDYLGQLWGPLGRSLRDGIGAWLWSSATALPHFYPTSLLPTMDSTPLKSVLQAHVNLDALRAPGAPQVFVTMTNARTGLPRIVGNADLTLEAILASACLPQFFRAVEIQDELFWDGGFTGNPTLWPLVRQRGESDILLIQLSPGLAAGNPSSVSEVRQRMAEIVFHSSLVAEMQAIQAIRDLTATGPRAAQNSFRQARFHRIGPPPDGLLGAGSSGDRSSRNLTALWDAGRDAGLGFLEDKGNLIGMRETLDLKAAFIDQRKTRLPVRTARTSSTGSPATPAAARRSTRSRSVNLQR